MNSKEYLTEIRKMDISIKRKEKQIAVLKELSTKMSPTLSDMPKAPARQSSFMQTAICKIIDLENDLEKMRRTLSTKKAEALSYIFKLENDEYQLLLIYRYLDMMSWEDISLEMNYSESTIFKKHGIALKRLSQILKTYS